MKIYVLPLVILCFALNAQAQPNLVHYHASYYQAPNYAELSWYLQGHPRPATVRLFRNENFGSFSETNIDVFVRAKGDTLFYTFTDSTTQRYQIYQYYVKAYDENRQEIVAPDTVNLPALDYLEMPMPTTIRAIGDSSRNAINISWELPLANLIKGLTIYRSTNSMDGFEPIATVDVNSTSYLDEQIRPATPYFYYMDLEYKMSDLRKRSTAFAASFISSDPPPIPEYVLAEAVPEGIKLSWEMDTFDVRGFWIYRGEVGRDHKLVNELVAAVDTIRHYEFVDTDTLNRDQVYEYTISAYSTSHVTGLPSDTMFVSPLSKPEPIRAPLGLTATADEEQIFVQWQDLQQSEPGMVLYQLIRRPGTDAVADTIYRSLNFYADTLVQKGINYSYSVRVVDANMNEGISSAAIVTKIAFSTPSPPSELAVHPVQNGVRLTWNSSPTDDVQRYVIYRFIRGQNPVMVGEVFANQGNRYVDETTQPGEVYFYFIRAISTDQVESNNSIEVRVER